MGNDLRVIYRGQDRARERECYQDLDENTDIATPGERKQDCRKDRNNHRPGQDLGNTTGPHAARLP